MKALRSNKNHKYDIPADWNVIKIPKDLQLEEAEEAEKEKELKETNDSIISNDVEGNTPALASTGGVTMDEEGNIQIQDIAVPVTEEEEEVDLNVLTNNSNNNNDEESEVIDESKYDIIAPMFVQARALFLHSEVLPADQVNLHWDPPNEIELRAFLVDKMGFNAERVNNGIKKLVEAQQKKSQKRMDSFFSVQPQDEAAKN